MWADGILVLPHTLPGEEIVLLWVKVYGKSPSYNLSLWSKAGDYNYLMLLMLDFKIEHQG